MAWVPTNYGFTNKFLATNSLKLLLLCWIIFSWQYGLLCSSTCSSEKVRHFGGTYCLQLQEWRVIQEGNKQKQVAVRVMLVAWFVAWLTLQHWRRHWCSSETSGQLRTTLRYNPEAALFNSPPTSAKAKNSSTSPYDIRPLMHMP